MTQMIAEVYRKVFGANVAECMESASPENVQRKRMIRTLLYKQGRANLRQIAEGEGTITGNVVTPAAIRGSIRRDDYIVNAPELYEQVNDIIIDVFSF